jgi:glycosyltransferase involved in cell wall biosynthesis
MIVARSFVTPLVLTYNEEPNIERTLGRLDWAERVVVIDSGSTDRTAALCRARPNVEVIERTFDDHVAQWNFGLAQVRTEWVLSLDADYVLSPAFVDELGQWQPTRDVHGYSAGFEYCVFGRPLRASLYPPRIVLFRRRQATFVADGHTQLLQLDGAPGTFRARIQHDDRKPLDRWFAEQWRYAGLEARHLTDAPPDRLRSIDRIRRRAVLAPALVGLYALIGRGLVWDGWPGWHYVWQRVVAESLLSLRLVDERLRGGLGKVE